MTAAHHLVERVSRAAARLMLGPANASVNGAWVHDWLVRDTPNQTSVINQHVL